jgi:hypothetical protein
MRLLWNVVKVVLVIALVIPVAIIALRMALGVFGAVLGIALFTLRLAVIGVIGYGAFRLFARLFSAPAPAPRPREIAPAPRVDPHYEAAMRELDRELGEIR